MTPSFVLHINGLWSLNTDWIFDWIIRLRAWLYTAISRKVVAKTVHATIPKGNMGYDQYTCSWHCSCRTYFCCFPLALANIRPWPLVPFFEIYLKNSELKTTHNTFRDCRVHFFRRPFSKQLYTRITCVTHYCFNVSLPANTNVVPRFLPLAG